MDAGPEVGVQGVHLVRVIGLDGREHTRLTPVGFHLPAVVLGEVVAPLVEDGQAHRDPLNFNITNFFYFFDPAGSHPAVRAGDIKPE